MRLWHFWLAVLVVAFLPHLVLLGSRLASIIAVGLRRPRPKPEPPPAEK